MVDQITQNFINDLASVGVYVQPAPTPQPTPTPAPTQTPAPTTTPAPTAPPSGESPDGSTVVVGVPGSITDAGTVVWTISASGVVQRNGVDDTTTRNVIKLYYKLHEVYQENSSNLWWVWRAAWVATSDPTIPAPASGNFTIRNGLIYQPNGKEFVARGINVNDYQLSTVVQNDACTPLLTAFPRLNCVRINCRGYTADASSYEPMVTRLTKAGIVVWFDDHTGISAPPLTGSQLSKEVEWFKMLTRTYMSNSYVWINGFNEPGNGYNLQSITDQQVAIYNGVRSVSPDKFVAMEEPSGGNPGLVGTNGKGYDGSAGMPPSAYANMHNIVWTPHFYGWMAKYSTDPAVVATAFQGSVSGASGVAAAQSITSVDGLVPVVIGEFGDSTTGTDIDADGSVVVDVVGKSGKGFLAWHWHASNNAGDMLTTDNAGTLTPYGKQVQGLILRAAQIEDGQTPAPTQTPVPTTAPPSGSGAPGIWLDGATGGMAYKVILPNGATPSGGYKLMVYEHQLDMGIPNNVPQLVSWMNNWFNSTTFRVAHPDVIVVAPLCDNTGDTSGNSYNFGGVSSSVTKGRDQVLAVVQATRNTYNINPKQITITGNSMGGLGTWELIAFRPDIFCAAMPLAGSNYTRDQVQTANALMQKPIWAVHGSSDTNVPIAWDRNMYATIHGAGGVMKYTELSMGHDVWDTVYPDPQYLGWLLAQSM